MTALLGVAAIWFGAVGVFGVILAVAVHTLDRRAPHAPAETPTNVYSLAAHRARRAA